MKRWLLAAACLVVFAALIFTACDDSAPADTTAPTVPDVATEASTDTPTGTPTEAPTDGATNDTSVDTPTEAPTEAPTEPFTPPTENPAVAPKTQFDYLKTYAHAYADKTFTIYGNVAKNANEFLILSLGGDMEFVLYFDGVSEPIPGSYVKLTATFEQTVDKGDYVDFNCFTMMATACETLGEAQAPNGGKFMYITASSLNVRSTPDSSVSDNKVGLLSSGDMVEVLEMGLGSNQNWCKIAFDCDAGYAYISMSYISETKP